MRKREKPEGEQLKEILDSLGKVRIELEDNKQSLKDCERQLATLEYFFGIEKPKLSWLGKLRKFLRLNTSS